MRCPICGKENNDENVYCESCGAKLRGKRQAIDNKKAIQLLIISLLSIVFVAECIYLVVLRKRPENQTPSSFNTADAASNESGQEAEEETEEVTEEVTEEEATERSYILPQSVPEEYYYYNGHTYAFYDASRYNFTTYDEVSEFCHTQGGHLAVINDQAENTYLYGLVTQNYDVTAFFGYTDKNEEGVWEWDGDTSTYTNWTNWGDWHLPDNGTSWGGGEWSNGGEDYAEFNYGRKDDIGPNDSTWNDASFMENTKIFLCEWEYDMRDAEAVR